MAYFVCLHSVKEDSPGHVCGLLYSKKRQVIDHAERYLPWTLGRIGVCEIMVDGDNDGEIEDITETVWDLHIERRATI